MAKVSVIIPAYNEGSVIAETVESVKRAFGETTHDFEVIVVNDCSTDDTKKHAEEAGAKVITHPMNVGYGNAILSGVRNAQHPWIAITDADGTYPIKDLPAMLDETVSRDLDMLVGVRTGRHYERGALERGARLAFRLLSEYVVGQRIPDVNSGLRIMRRSMVERFSPLLSGGFSFTTTITVIGFLTYSFIDYRPIDYYEREGKSHVRYFRDTLRAAQILVMTILFFNPIKLFLIQCVAMVLVGAATFVLSLILPSFTTPLLILFLTAFFLNVLVAFAFLAEQQRVYLATGSMPKRGYQPDRDEE